MSQHTTLDKIAASLTVSLDSTKTLAAAESRCGSIAALGLITAVEKALDDLTALRMTSLRDELLAPPPIAGNCDDHEEISADFLRDPLSWPDDSDLVYFSPPHVFDYADASQWDAWTDADRWAPTPLEVLARGFSDAEAARSDADWDDLYNAAYPDLMTDADLMAAGLAVG
ncbi:hypothetical protein [Paludisphaera rhizosphaerae]|uniref:hypothetical protein n=1 Tax=Paludisphaera rhizosphaerae TaxID=2711216 RepID=UPI0013ED6C48|nr:hypothetical protein [Paludisphaera rhizosphaerae]